MSEVKSCFTVLFDEPFWIGLYEREDERGYAAAKVTFGAEPKDYEVYAFLLENRRQLLFSPPQKGGEAEERRVSPKRMQREIGARLKAQGVGTKAQQALSAQREQNKLERKIVSREAREEEARRQFALRQEKKKDKHRGH